MAALLSRALGRSRRPTGAVLAMVLACTAYAGEFSVAPIRADFRPGVISETLTITNYSPEALRVSVKLMAWAQDERGGDVYTDSTDLVYFPRQLDIPAQGRRLVRLGAGPQPASGTGTERAYRLFIEEEPPPGSTSGAQVNFYFRFGVPVFVTPAGAAPKPEVTGITVAGGKVEVRVRNGGNQQFRLTRVTLRGEGGFSAEASGWYSLAGTSRSYSFDLPAAACRQVRSLRFVGEGEAGVRLEQAVDVDPASCG